MKAIARARANIALAKYWGKADARLNLPAVPSISLTLDGLVTDTSVELDPKAKSDTLILGERRGTPAETARVTELLDRVRRMAHSKTRARVITRNSFPTASGLASSASGFAALAGAAASAYGLALTPSALSAIARQSSASAARSIFGGFVELPVGVRGDAGLAARVLFAPDHWDVRIVVAVATDGEKAVGSTNGMGASRDTSPLYDAWVAAAPKLTREVAKGIAARDLERVGRAMEQSTFAFHAAAMTASPPILYWQPVTVAVLHAARALRDTRGIPVYATMDAGPHVKLLCEAKDSRRVSNAMQRVPGVLRTIIARPGAGLELR